VAARKDGDATLTSRQRDVLRFIVEFSSRKGWAPTRAEMLEGLEMRSAVALERHLRALERAGYIRTEPGSARAVQLLLKSVFYAGREEWG
jgi:repressor LexA